MKRWAYYDVENVYLSCTWNSNKVNGVVTSILWIIDAVQLGFFAINVLVSTNCTIQQLE